MAAMPSFADSLAALDARFLRVAAERRLPGIAWGVVRDGVLVHAGGHGTARDGEDRTPDADTVFRIASMTKSFTAATVLSLRDEGLLSLDDAVGRWVPELAGWGPLTDDGGPITVRQLLTMSAGLPTDDPWGDRQQGLPLDAFGRLLAASPTLVWPAGVTFDYSNLGYGILGRVITAAAGAEYRDVVRARLLAPLGMTSTAYEAESVDEARLAHGYVRRGDALLREGMDEYGALASMGGLFSTVRDLSRWVAGFLDAFPARSAGPGDAGSRAGSHPLGRASRREMQQVHRLIPFDVDPHAPDADVHGAAVGYGFGLLHMSRLDVGTFVSHSGGYPGFGSNMTWHPASGLGVIALANHRYAGVSGAVAEALEALVRADVVPARRVRPVAAVTQLAASLEGLLASWDDEVADRVFAMNVDLDEPLPLRRAAMERLAAASGPFAVDVTRADTSTAPSDRTWWLRGTHGWVKAYLLMSPEPSPRIQAYSLSLVGDPSERLDAAASAILAACAHASLRPTWPASLVAAAALDVAAVERSLLAGAARFGAMSLGLPIAGDGVAESTWELVTERSMATLRVAMDPETGAITACDLRTAYRTAPAEAW